MEFLIDADLPNSTVEPFKEKGFEAVHVREKGLGKSPDSKISEYANENSLMLVTRDRDFGNPMLNNTVENGVIIVELHNYAPGRQNSRIEDFLEKAKIEKIKESIIILEDSRYRVRKY